MEHTFWWGQTDNGYSYHGWLKKSAMKKNKWTKNNKLDDGSTILYKVIRKDLSDTLNGRSISDTEKALLQKSVCNIWVTTTWPVWLERTWEAWRSSFITLYIGLQKILIMFTIKHTKSTKALKQEQRSPNERHMCQKSGLYSRYELKSNSHGPKKRKNIA